MVTEREQRRAVPVGLEVDVPPGPTVATVGSAPGHVGLPPERQRTGAAVSTTQVDVHLVHERHQHRIRTPLSGSDGLAEGRSSEWRSGLGARVDVDELAALAVTEAHNAVGGGEQRVVAALADVLARVALRAALTDDDGAGADAGPAVDLHTEALRIRVAPVA